MQSDWVATFKKTYLVAGLGESEIAKIAELAEVKNFLAGEFVIRRGDAPKSLWVVLAGRVDLITEDGDTIAKAAPGNLLGEVGVLDYHPSLVDGVCEGFSTLAEIPLDRLRALLNQDRTTGFMVLANIGAVMCQRLREAEEVIHHLHQHDAWDGSY